MTQTLFHEPRICVRAVRATVIQAVFKTRSNNGTWRRIIRRRFANVLLCRMLCVHTEDSTSKRSYCVCFIKLGELSVLKSEKNEL